MNRALTDLLRAHARGRPGVTLDSLRRQFAYDRLLTRVFAGVCNCPTGSPFQITPGAPAMREWHETTPALSIVTSLKRSRPQLRSLTQL